MVLENLKVAIKNLLFSTWHTCSYHGTKVKLPFNPRKGVCDCCGRKAKTNRHHWKYEYTRKQILENNMLVLNYTSELCFNPCHELGNSLRKLFSDSPNIIIENPSPIIKKLLDLRQKAIKEGEKWAKSTNKNGKV